MTSIVVQNSSSSIHQKSEIEVTTPAASMSEQSEPTSQDPSTDQTKGGKIKKLIVASLLLGFVAYIVIDAASGANNVSDLVDDFLEWVEDNPTEGVFAFIGVYFIATVFFVPGTILTLGAGFVFSTAFGLGVGVLLGTLAVFLGASLGAIASFLLGRFLLRDWVSTLTGKFAVFEALDVSLAENGLKIMALLRLSPVIPFNALNYIGGVTSISFRDNALALFFILPGTILYVFLGSSAGSLSDSEEMEDPTVTIITIVFGIVFGFLGVGATTYYAKKELNRVLEKREAEASDAVDVDGHVDSSRSDVV